MAINNDPASLYDQKIVWLKQNPSACAKPFQNLFLLQGSRGMRAIPCCNWRENDLEFGRPFSELFQEIKQDVLDQKTNSQCHVCVHSEQHNSVSERMRDSVNTLSSNLEFSPQTDSNRVTIKFSNLCNLACRSCQPEFSSLLADVLKQPALDHFVQDITDDPVIWSTVKQYLVDVLNTYRFVEINLTGGESMIQPGLDRLMEFLDSLGEDFSQRVILSATTNGTSINQMFVDAIPKFRRVFLNFSIDSVGENYHYVRWPARFERIERTVQQALDLKKANPGQFDFNINLVISVSNVFYIDSIAEYWDQWGKTHNQQPDFSIMYLHWPEYAAVEVMPKRYRLELAQRCNRALQIAQASDNPGWNTFRTFIEGLHAFCLGDSPDNNRLWNEYLTMAADFDNRTQIEMKDYNSRLWDLLSESDQESYYQVRG
jgi:sulfatase maturation enzyme AslB (radical SAM superfamily)